MNKGNISIISIKDKDLNDFLQNQKYQNKKGLIQIGQIKPQDNTF